MIFRSFLMTVPRGFLVTVPLQFPHGSLTVSSKFLHGSLLVGIVSNLVDLVGVWLPWLAFG